jgi:IclR family transcriptional regulator, pca regulon regulatory protein
MPRVKRSQQEQENVDVHGPDFLESLARGLRVIRAFNVAPRPMTLSEVAKIADLPRATARRTLHTLERLGYVTGDGKLFRLTSRVLTLASAYLSSNQISTVLQPAMDRVAGLAQEVCSAAILDGDDAVFIARASPARVFLTGLEIGYRLPAFCTSVGRALLGGLNDKELAEFIKRIEPKAMTPHTVVTKPKLKTIIASDRLKGYSLVDQEAEPGFRSIAAPVRRYDGVVVAAINIGAHVDRVSVARLRDDYLPLLRAAATEVQPLLC